MKAGGEAGQERTTWLDGISDSMDMSFSKFRDIAEDREAWRGAVHGVPKGSDTTEQLHSWCKSCFHYIGGQRAPKRGEKGIAEGQGGKEQTDGLNS